jgi:hypothetical protein
MILKIPILRTDGPSSQHKDPLTAQDMYSDMIDLHLHGLGICEKGFCTHVLYAGLQKCYIQVRET